LPIASRFIKFNLAAFNFVICLENGETVYQILLAGQDPRLLSTRAAVLRKISGHVVSCNAAEALKFLESETPNLVVLCHSLSVEEAESVADKAHERAQGTCVLMLISEAHPERPHRGVKFDAVTLPDPTRLIARTAELLHGSPNHRLKEVVKRQPSRSGP
jgi:DNA-binding response OmpR family regulator